MERKDLRKDPLPDLERGGVPDSLSRGREWRWNGIWKRSFSRSGHDDVFWVVARE
jgi:hypothetical protein